MGAPQTGEWPSGLRLYGMARAFLSWVRIPLLPQAIVCGIFVVIKWIGHGCLGGTRARKFKQIKTWQKLQEWNALNPIG